MKRNIITGALCLGLLFCNACASLYFSRLEPPAEVCRIDGLDRLPYRELWQGFIFNGEKVGFTYLRITPLPDGERYTLSSEARLRILFLGTGSDIFMKSEDIVHADLTLDSFHYEQVIDGKILTIDGGVREGRFRATRTLDRRETTIEHRLDAPLYPTSIINLYPVMKGLKIGADYRYDVFDAQTQSFTEVRQSVLSFEESTALVVEPSYRIRTGLYDQEVSTWINTRGEAVFELAMSGILITCRESEEQARRYLIEAGFNKKDMVLDFSLVRTEEPIPCPRELTVLEIELEGLGGVLPLLQGPGQEATASGDDPAAPARFRLSRDPAGPLIHQEETLDEGDRILYLAATSHMECDAPEIRTAAEKIIGDSSEPLDKIGKLARWVSDEVADEATDSFSALEVLRNRRGECQAHTLLFTALARAAGIPTRLAGGLLYMEDAGFLYHSWAECYAGGWVAVDPTLAQVGVDATHIKLVQGPCWTSTLTLGKVVGRIRARVITFEGPC
ncbi:MAG: transglutaminase domain-containing protein [Deltaproteobacteria bacterium]|nr:transglutaminase domain-containing protein [Deltaproteobacteria bacterium]